MIQPNISQLGHSKSYEYKIIITTGLALFAMFFGAGNILFPLYLGANAGQHITLTALGFLITGVGVPFLGLVATSLFKGNCHEFFARLGRVPGFLLITFLMIIIGPLAAMPRTESTTFHTLSPYLPDFLNHNPTFSLIYCSIIFLLAYRETKVIDILGLFLSPIKIISFAALIIIGFIYAEPSLPTALSSTAAFRIALLNGYNTMDLLGAFFFCSVAFKSIEHATQTNIQLDTRRMTLQACIIGALLTSTIYLGFMSIAYHHASELQGLAEEQMISAISTAVLGKFGGLFVCISVSFACVATALALADVCTIYLHEEIFKKRIPKLACLTLVMLVTYLVSNLGFQGILNFSVPILHVVYPSLIVLCVLNILYKWKGLKPIKAPVFITAIIFIGLLYHKTILGWF